MQQEVASELKYVFIGYDKTPTFMNRNLMKDHVHYNQDGLNEIGIEVGNMASKILK